MTFAGGKKWGQDAEHFSNIAEFLWYFNHLHIKCTDYLLHLVVLWTILWLDNFVGSLIIHVLISLFLTWWRLLLNHEYSLSNICSVDFYMFVFKNLAADNPKHHSHTGFYEEKQKFSTTKNHLHFFFQKTIQNLYILLRFVQI